MSDNQRSCVFIGAHADDIELHAGGYAARQASRGQKIHFVMVTNNMSGNLLPEGKADAQPYRLPPKQTREIRHREQQAAADVIGAKTHFLDYPQRHYWDGSKPVTLTYAPTKFDDYAAASDKPPIIIAAQNPKAIADMGELLVSLKPEVIVTQTITDVDPEHHAVASLVWQAYRARAADLVGARLLFWAPGTTSHGGMLPQHFDHYVSLSQQDVDRKMQMLRCHASQMTTRRLEMALGRARHWGAELGVQYVEPFTTVFNGLAKD